jgi:hypothetical protein
MDGFIKVCLKIFYWGRWYLERGPVWDAAPNSKEASTDASNRHISFPVGVYLRSADEDALIENK